MIEICMLVLSESGDYTPLSAQPVMVRIPDPIKNDAF